MDKYGEEGDGIYCYPNSKVLRNKFSIQDDLLLQEAEREFSEQAILEIDYQEPPYNLNSLKSIHFVLFSDVYDWAGKLRQVDISKGNTRFCTFSRIEAEANKLFNHLSGQQYFKNLDKNKLIEALADFYCELNVIHPFREGNGRAQRIFFEHLIAYCGYGIDWSLIKNQDEWVQANIHGFYGNLEPLIEIFQRCLIDPSSY